MWCLLMSDAADFAIFHFSRRASFGWTFVAEVCWIGVLRLVHHLFVFSTCLLQFFLALVVLLLRFVGGAFGDFFAFGRIVFLGHAGVQRGGLGGFVGLALSFSSLPLGLPVGRDRQ